MVILSTLPEQTKSGTLCTLSELKRQLQIEDDDTTDNTILEDLISTAIEFVEDDTKSDVLDTANVLTYQIPHNDSIQSIYRINRAPLRTFSKLEVKINDAWVEVVADQYRDYKNHNYFEIHLTGAWPAGTITHVQFTFITGYTDAKRPKRLKQATILKAADLYDTERSSYVVGTISSNLKTYERLISKHMRRYWN